eukprot:gene11717-8062_t
MSKKRKKRDTSTFTDTEGKNKENHRNPGLGYTLRSVPSIKCPYELENEWSIGEKRIFSATGTWDSLTVDFTNRNICVGGSSGASSQYPPLCTFRSLRFF